MGLSIRPATEADLGAAAELIKDQPLFEPYGITPATLARSLGTALTRGDELHVALKGEEVTGLVWFELRGAFGRSGYLRLLVTSPEVQGTGLGQRLLATAEELVFAQADDLFLLVNSTNEGARRFYARHGYGETGTITDYIAPGLNEVLMRKSVL